jgi:hypothetical protein
MSRIAIVILIYHIHKPIYKVNLLGSSRRRNVFPVRYGQTYRVELRFKLKIGQWIISGIVRFILIYHRQKPIDNINLLGS